jgi:hypothetical protein
MASSATEAISGTVSSPTATAATPVENGPCQGPNGRTRSASGRSSWNANRPITTVGTPSSTSSIGLMVLRTLVGAYSDR